MEYMEMLGEHINEKVDAVIRDGRHIMGERPVVLAALNICDEYYKLMAEKSSVDMNELSVLKNENQSLKAENEELWADNDRLQKESDEIKAGHIEAEETKAIARSIELQKELDEAMTQIKFLEGQIKLLEEKNAKMKKDHERREQEIFDMFDNPVKKGNDQK
jgi:cell division protein ZapA (FtsZ GTPase activity inhibitor)